MGKRLVDSNGNAVLFGDRAILVETQTDADLYGVIGWYKISKDLNEIDYSGNPSTVSVWQDSIAKQNLTVNFISGSKISYTGILVNDCIKFDQTAILPSGLAANKRYFVLAVTSSQAQLSETRGGMAVSFADGGSSASAKEYNYAYNTVVANQPKLFLNYRNGWPALQSISYQKLILNKNITCNSFYVSSIITESYVVALWFLGLNAEYQGFGYNGPPVNLFSNPKTLQNNAISSSVVKYTFSDFYYSGTSQASINKFFSRISGVGSDNDNAKGYITEMFFFSYVKNTDQLTQFRAYSTQKYAY